MSRLKSYCLGVVICFATVIGKGQEINLSDTISVEILSGEIKSALQKISDNTGLRFAYRNSLIQNIKVSRKNYNTTLEEILNDLFIKNRLCYTFNSKQIIIHTNCLPKHYTITGVVFEDSTMHTVPYVSVSMIDNATGTIADENGEFELNLNFRSGEKDTLIFSAMGYLRDTFIIASGVSKNISTILEKKYYPIPETVVTPEEYFNKKEGNIKNRASGSLYIDTHGQQTALFIKNRNKKTIEGHFQSIEFYISKKGNTDAPFRIRIYLADSNGMPGKDLIEDALVVKPDISDGWYYVDISHLNIELPDDGVFIAMEGIFPDDYSELIGSSDFIDLSNQNKKNQQKLLTYGQRLGYNRKCRKDTWHYSMSRVWFQIEKQSFGVMIAAVVNYRKKKEIKKL